MCSNCELCMAMAKRQKRLDSFFKRTVLSTCDDNQESTRERSPPQPSANDNPEPPQVVVDNPTYLSIERDPGLRLPMWKYLVNSRDEIRRAYLRSGPHHVVIPEYPVSGPKSHPRRFQAKWYSEYPWLEYSITNDRAYCFYCYLFVEEPNAHDGQDVFVVNSFNNWKRVKGKNCSFMKHVGHGPNSQHNNAVKFCVDLLNQAGHIDKAIKRQTDEEIKRNRLRVKTSIDLVRLISFQGIAFRGHDERSGSKNRGNFIELLKHTASYNAEVASVVLNNAPKNAKYISPDIQKEILHVFAEKVRKKIIADIGNSKFCIMVDEASDESKKEKMAIVLRFVDNKGCIQERFFDLIHVTNTSSATLYSSICATLTSYKLATQNIRGQGYDGASNMRGEWKGLQALFLKENPCAYYIHCMAHRLQLALVTAAREVDFVHEFFMSLSLIVNAAGASCKRHDELQAAQAAEIARMLECDEPEIETGTGANQIGTLKRAGDTRWSSHFTSICSLIRMYNPTCIVLENIKKEGCNYKTRGEAGAALRRLTYFEFVFILHMMKRILGITDVLCQSLQQKSQEIVSAMHLVSSTREQIKNLRDDQWVSFLGNVIDFCKKRDIDFPNLATPYFEGRSVRNQDSVTKEHHYHYDIFNETIDSQLQEIDTRFSEKIVELLKLSSAFDPREGYKSFTEDAIMKLANEYYFLDFTRQELDVLEFQLKHFKSTVKDHPSLRNLSCIAELCQGLATTGVANHYYLVDRLIRLVLTLPVSTASVERAFSAMKIVKNRLRNKMGDEFLADNLLLYIEKEIAETFSLDSILDSFNDLRERKVQLQLSK